MGIAATATTPQIALAAPGSALYSPTSRSCQVIDERQQDKVDLSSRKGGLIFRNEWKKPAGMRYEDWKPLDHDRAQEPVLSLPYVSP